MARSKTLYCLAGRLGVTQGMDTQALDSVNEDNDGEIPESSNYDWKVDISHLLSEQLGKQMPMMATYRVKGVHLSLRNVNDTVDNDASLAIGGTINWYSPTKHRIDALQYTRKFMQDKFGGINNVDSPFGAWANDKKYRGLRFNWNADNDGVNGAILDESTVLAGTEYSLYEIFDHYNQAIGGFPSEEGYDSAGSPGDALWNTRTGLDEVDSLYWNIAYTNRIQTSSFNDDGEYNAPSFQTFDFFAPNNHLSVLGGLMHVHAFHSNTDTAGLVEDDYYIQCTIMVEGWEEF